MKILLDTHIYLWWLTDSPRLTPAARELIMAAEVVYVSSASVWEAAIKIGTGKLTAKLDELIDQIAANDFTALDVRLRHVAALATLPSLHRDPFDRLLVAQALAEPVNLLTADPQLAGYPARITLI